MLDLDGFGVKNLTQFLNSIIDNIDDSNSGMLLKILLIKSA